MFHCQQVMANVRFVAELLLTVSVPVSLSRTDQDPVQWDTAEKDIAVVEEKLHCCIF